MITTSNFIKTERVASHAPSNGSFESSTEICGTYTLPNFGVNSKNQSDREIYWSTFKKVEKNSDFVCYDPTYEDFWTLRCLPKFKRHVLIGSSKAARQVLSVDELL